MRMVSKEELSVGDIQGELLERRALPIGKTQFEEWSDRIISAAGVEGTTRSLKNALAHMVMHLGPTEAFKEDGYFVLSLRKAAVNQTVHAYVEELQAEKKRAEETASTGAVDGILEKQSVQTAGC